MLVLTGVSSQQNPGRDFATEEEALRRHEYLVKLGTE
jgi:hypothetical protein